MSKTRIQPIFLIPLALMVLALVLTPARAAAPAGDSVDLEALDAYLQDQVQANHIPGLAVGVVEGGQVRFLKGYGQARPGEPVTPQTQFTIGSVTKSFTGLAVMQLVEQGKLELDAPVQRYIPWFQVADPDASARITVRHLLNQTSGLSPAGDPHNSTYFTSLEEQVRALKDARLTAPVGSRFQYFNQNYRILGYLIEQVSGQPYGEYMQAHVFEPLQMANTTADPAQAPHLAQGHSQFFGQPLTWNERFYPGLLPSGYLISSAEDMTHYLQALLAQGEFGGQALVQPETWQAMVTPPGEIDSPYGMGWMVDEDPEVGGAFYYHDGATENFSSAVMLLPGKQSGIVLLYNQSGLIPLMTSLPGVLTGATRLLAGGTPVVEGYGWIGWVLAVAAGLHLAFEVWRVTRLPAWIRSAARKAAWKRWLQALPELVIPLVLLVGLPGFIASLMNETGDWKAIFSVLPDLTAWWLLAILIALGRGLVKTGWLIRRKMA